jgi:hypothetical protein
MLQTLSFLLLQIYTYERIKLGNAYIVFSVSFQILVNDNLILYPLPVNGTLNSIFTSYAKITPLAPRAVQYGCAW